MTASRPLPLRRRDPRTVRAGAEPGAAVAGRGGRPGPATKTGEESEDEAFVYGDDDEDLPAAQVAAAGATADPVKDYLKQIGKVPLLNAEQEVELAKRIEAGLFAEEKLAEGRADAAPGRARRHGVDRRGRPPGQEPPAGGQPAAGGLAGQAVHRPRACCSWT